MQRRRRTMVGFSNIGFSLWICPVSAQMLRLKLPDRTPQAEACATVAERVTMNRGDGK